MSAAGSSPAIRTRPPPLQILVRSSYDFCHICAQQSSNGATDQNAAARAKRYRSARKLRTRSTPQLHVHFPFEGSYTFMPFIDA